MPSPVDPSQPHPARLRVGVIGAGKVGVVLGAARAEPLRGLSEGRAPAEPPVPGRLLAHASGRYGVGVLDATTRRGGLPLALHPVMTFAGRSDDLNRLAGICSGAPPPAALRRGAGGLVFEVGGEPVFIDEDNRGLYHAALASGA